MTTDLKLHKCYATKTKREAVLNMCGGCAEWWNYVLKFDKEGFDLYIEDSSGLCHIQRNPKLFWNMETEEVLLGEPKPEEEDIFVAIDEEFFIPW